MEQIEHFQNKGFSTVENIYSADEFELILHQISLAEATEKETFRKSTDLFAIKQFLKEIPAAIQILFNEKLKEVLNTLLGDHYFVDITRTAESENTCSVPKGGIMLMKPLLMHSSERTTDNRQRRVIHLELANRKLPAGLNWAE